MEKKQKFKRSGKSKWKKKLKNGDILYDGNIMKKSDGEHIYVRMASIRRSNRGIFREQSR